MKTLQYLIVSLCLLLILCLLFDSYRGPLKSTTEVITDIYQTGGSTRRSAPSYYITTSITNDHDVSINVANSVSVGDTVKIYKSAIDNSTQLMDDLYGGSVVRYRIGLIRCGVGWVCISIISVVAVLFMIYYDRSLDYGARIGVTTIIMIATALVT